MVSQSRSASARASRSARGTSGTRRSAGGNARSARTDATRKPAARHNGGGSHRSYGSKGPKPKGRKKHLILKWFLGIVAVCIAAGVGAFAYLYITTEVPQPEKFALAEKTTVYYADGTTTLGSFAEQNREIIECKNLPDYVGKAIVASEDRTFYTNRGIDLKGIARALVNNITKGTRQGGSTITQQYAERYYLGETTSYTGKLREAILAVKIAQQQDKSEVLCNYMNTIYLGRGSYGIQAAAQAYFGKDAKDLSLAEAATIAGIIPAPSTWDPAQNPDMATQRMQRVLRIMKEDGYITADEQAQAKTLPATVEYTQNNVYSGPNGYLLTTVENKSNIIDNDNALDLTNEPAVKNLSEANKEYLTKDGKTYGISVSSWESGIVYNKDLLAKVGADSIPENWDDFLALLKKLKDAGITPYLEPVDDVPKIFQAFLGAKYDLAGDTEAEKAIFEGKSTFEKEWTPELEQWYRLWDEDLVTRDAVGIDGNAVKTQFLNGELATMTTGPWDFKDLKSSNLNFGIAPVPALDGGEVYGAGSPSPGLAIYSKISDKKLDAA